MSHRGHDVQMLQLDNTGIVQPKRLLVVGATVLILVTVSYRHILKETVAVTKQISLLWLAIGVRGSGTHDAMSP